MKLLELSFQDGGARFHAEGKLPTRGLIVRIDNTLLCNDSIESESAQTFLDNQPCCLLIGRGWIDDPTYVAICVRAHEELAITRTA